MTPLVPVMTNAGLASLMASHNQGLEGRITHVALGDGGVGAGAGYTPTAVQAGLVRERVRVPVGGGERVAPREIRVEALVDTGPSFWMREAAFLLDDGVPLAIWSDPVTVLGYRDNGIPLVVAYYLALTAVPPDSVTVEVSGPSVNLFITEPFAVLATEVIRLQTRDMQRELDRLTPIIQHTWY